MGAPLDSAKHEWEEAQLFLWGCKHWTGGRKLKCLDVYHNHNHMSGTGVLVPGHLKGEKQGKQKRKEFVYIKIAKGMWM